MKNKFLLVSGCLTLIIMVFGVLLFSRPENSSTFPPPTGYEYFWKEDCADCTKVKDFLDSWKGTKEITITEIDVEASKTNISRFADRGQYCKFPKEALGVPILVTPKGTCLSGSDLIISHIKDATSMK